MKTIPVIATTMLILACLAASVAAEGKFDTVLTASDIEKITGLTGVKLVPREPMNKFKNGDLNFVSGENQPVLMVLFRPVVVADTNMFDNMKADSGYFKTAVTGIGEEAFTSPAFAPQFSINLRKGKYIAIVTTHVDPKDRTRTLLTMDQLTAIARHIASKM